MIGADMYGRYEGTDRRLWRGGWTGWKGSHEGCPCGIDIWVGMGILHIGRIRVYGIWG